MNLKKKMVTCLPDSWQDKILANVIASNRWNRIPTFHMLFESLVLMGGDRNDILHAFSEAKDLDHDFFIQARKIAKQRKESAHRISDPNLKRIEYQKAILLYYLADWVTFEMEQVRLNYQDLLECSTKLDKCSSIPTKKVYLPWKVGHIACRFRIPLISRELYPCVLLVQGNDTIKEALLFIEDLLLENGICVLNIDQSGWGESLISGNHFESLDDAKLIAEEAYNFLGTQSLIDMNNLAVFGFSGGGTWSAMTASTFPKLKAMVSVGGAIYNLDKSINGLPAMQKRQVMKHWGVTKTGIQEILPSLDFKTILPNINCRVLLVHGEKDTLVPINYIHTATKLISGQTDTIFVKNGDHMCSATLKETQIPQIMKWFQEIFN